MFCAKCGKEVAETSKFCKYCGNELKEVENQMTNQSEENMKEMKLENNKEMKVIFSRPKKMTGAVVPIEIFIDGNSVAKLGNGAVAEVSVPYGNHKLVLSGWSTGTSETTVSFSEEYDITRIDIAIKMGLVAGKPEIISIKNEKVGAKTNQVQEAPNNVQNSNANTSNVNTSNTESTVVNATSGIEGNNSWNPSAITGFVCSIVGIFIFGWLELLALCFTITAMNQMKTFKNQKGKGLAIAGLVISIVGIVLWIISIVFNVVF